FTAKDGIRDRNVTGVQTCALPISTVSTSCAPAVFRCAPEKRGINMDITIILNYLIRGLSLGSVYAIIALGYTMVYGIAKMLNFAHGDVIMVGGYVCFFAMSGLSGHFAEGSLAAAVVPALAGTVLAMVVCTVLGV